LWRRLVLAKLHPPPVRTCQRQPSQSSTSAPAGSSASFPPRLPSRPCGAVLYKGKALLPVRWPRPSAHRVLLQLLKSAGWNLGRLGAEDSLGRRQAAGRCRHGSGTRLGHTMLQKSRGHNLQAELVRLSWSPDETRAPSLRPALLAGLCQCLTAMRVLELYTPDRLQRLAATCRSIAARHSPGAL